MSSSVRPHLRRQCRWTGERLKISGVSQKYALPMLSLTKNSIQLDATNPETGPVLGPETAQFDVAIQERNSDVCKVKAARLNIRHQQRGYKSLGLVRNKTSIIR